METIASFKLSSVSLLDMTSSRHLTLGVARTSEQVSFGQPRRRRPCANFEDDVLLVVGVLGDQQDLQLLQQRVASHGERRQFLLGQLAHVGVAALGQFLSAGDVLFDDLVLAEFLDERLQLRQGLGGLPELGGVGL
jgi:hypothetical protein